MVLGLFLASCSGGGSKLIVQLKTDYLPGVEFIEVRNELRRQLSGGVAPEVTAVDAVTAFAGMDVVSGERVGVLPVPEAGTYVLETRLLAPDGSTVAARSTRLRVAGRTATTVVITRSCEEVDCSGSPIGATECVGGRCVVPECRPEEPERCGPPECAGAEDCAVTVSCAEGRCVDGACFRVTRAGACGPGMWCDPLVGCTAEAPDASTGCAGEETCNGADDDCDGTVDEGFDFDTDVDHCGACGRACVNEHGGTACAGGTCVPSCVLGWDDCNGVGEDGCEADLSEVAHCGACNMACGGSAPLCNPVESGYACGDTCGDGQQNGDESDVDCGGSQCERCGLDAACRSAADCGSGMICPDGRCVSSCGECVPDLEDREPCGDCGVQTRTCAGDCTWGNFSACSGEGVCTPGVQATRGCGDCGSEAQTCQADCTWGPFEGCSGEGVCAPGTEDGTGCPHACMVTACDGTCGWGATCDACASSCSAVAVCGIGCPAGYYASEYDYALACGGPTLVDNQTLCVPICGAGFWTCGVDACPAGYYAAEQDYRLVCGGETLVSNSARCARTAGTFWACGDTCPTNWVITQRDYRLECAGATLVDNSVLCVPL